MLQCLLFVVLVFMVENCSGKSLCVVQFFNVVISFWLGKQCLLNSISFGFWFSFSGYLMLSMFGISFVMVVFNMIMMFGLMCFVEVCVLCSLIFFFILLMLYSVILGLFIVCNSLVIIVQSMWLFNVLSIILFSFQQVKLVFGLIKLLIFMLCFFIFL